VKCRWERRYGLSSQRDGCYFFFGSLLGAPPFYCKIWEAVALVGGILKHRIFLLLPVISGKEKGVI
jgi:hypothetical protein